jgi:hypothetical protein
MMTKLEWQKHAKNAHNGVYNMTQLEHVRSRINGVIATIEELRKAKRNEIPMPLFANSHSIKNLLLEYKRLWRIETQMKMEQEKAKEFTQ